MSHNVKITGDNNDTRAKVTKYGQLVVAPLSYSEPVFVELLVPGDAYNFIEPVAGEAVVITDIIVSANKDVSATTPATVRIFQSDEADSINIIKGIIAPQLTRSSNVDYTGLNMFVPEGRWINATTDDATVLVTIMYYRVPREFV